MNRCRTQQCSTFRCHSFIYFIKDASKHIWILCFYSVFPLFHFVCLVFHLKERHLISLQLWCIFQILQNVSSSLRYVTLCHANWNLRCNIEKTFNILHDFNEKNKFFKQSWMRGICLMKMMMLKISIIQKKIARENLYFS